MIIADLEDMHQKLSELLGSPDTLKTIDILESLFQVSGKVGLSSSRSWLGHQSQIYYSDFTPPPAGRTFSVEWGLMHEDHRNPSGWRYYQPLEVKRLIEQQAGNPDLKPINDHALRGANLLRNIQHDLQSILHTVSSSDEFLTSLISQVNELKLLSKSEICAKVEPRDQIVSRDSKAWSQGRWIPPHVEVWVEAEYLKQPFDLCRVLSRLVRATCTHLQRKSYSSNPHISTGSRVFIGHGHSRIWKDLKDFIQDKLKLEWEEYNRVSTAGVATTARLEEMLGNARFAFIVMTAEDEQLDGKIRARMNVIHEVGLFQGRLGLKRAIVLLESGCEEFSNIEGLGQIRFPAGDVTAKFEDIRDVLKREAIIV